MKKSKRLLQGANWGVFLILALALLFIVNYLGYRHYHRWDWSSASTSRLSQQTKKVLGHLEHPVKVVVFLAPGGDLYTHVNGLLSSYKAAAPAGKFSVEYIDPDRQRARMEMLARKYNVTRANVVVFSSNGHSKYVTMDQMADYSASGAKEITSRPFSSWDSRNCRTMRIWLWSPAPNILSPLRKPPCWKTT
ncbi:MAG: Gldg family protein [Acidobacteriota bacterium]